jgi:hypothetical protein
MPLKQGSENFRGPQEQSGDISLGRMAIPSPATNTASRGSGGSGVKVTTVQIDRRDRPVFPVGIPEPPEDIGLLTIPSFPTVGEFPRTDQAWRIFGEISGGQTPPAQRRLPVVAAPAQILPQVRSSPIPTLGVGLPTINQEVFIMPDVTDLQAWMRGVIPGDGDLGNLGAGVLGMFGGSQTTTGVPTVQTVATSPGINSPVAPPACMDTRKQYCLKFSNGAWKWVKKTRRRRKRLATNTDIKDLSSLKGVLGGGKSLDLWIATHGN